MKNTNKNETLRTSAKRQTLKGVAFGVALTLMFQSIVFNPALFANAANVVLQTIQVHFGSVKKIVVDKAERVPPDDMKPFIYDGRTYVSLRWAGGGDSGQARELGRRDRNGYDRG